jgi:hypothetical protein
MDCYNHFFFLPSGYPVIAPYENTLYRGEVLDVLPDGRVMVEFVDYGNMAVLDPEL